jgi:hypothetical protein
MTPSRLARAVLGALLLSGCASALEPVVVLRDQRYTVEIADQPEEQIRGLMFRRELAPDRGMLFTYDRAQPQSFWMHNCYIPLDILYFDEHARFINGHYNVPPCNGDRCPTYAAQAPARYVLELGGGVGQALGLAPGDELTLPR